MTTHFKRTLHTHRTAIGGVPPAFPVTMTRFMTLHANLLHDAPIQPFPLHPSTLSNTPCCTTVLRTLPPARRGALCGSALEREHVLSFRCV
mmetsp:Transcript_53021/g.133321  ORF Transcript_53021/g.133321 Transcript_53021/m.133321 type:complete len:91 (-) Transcript_53021:35-307(-)